MTFTTAKYTNENNTSISAETDDGKTLHIPAVEGNRHYRELIESGIIIEAFIPPDIPEEQQAAELLRSQGITRNTLIDALLIKERGKNANLNNINGQINSVSAQFGVDPDDVIELI